MTKFDSKPKDNDSASFSCGAIVSSHNKNATKEFYGMASCQEKNQSGGMLKSKISQNKIKKIDFCSIKRKKKKAIKSLKKPNQKNIDYPKNALIFKIKFLKDGAVIPTPSSFKPTSYLKHFMNNLIADGDEIPYSLVENIKFIKDSQILIVQVKTNLQDIKTIHNSAKINMKNNPKLYKKALIGTNNIQFILQN